MVRMVKTPEAVKTVVPCPHCGGSKQDPRDGGSECPACIDGTWDLTDLEQWEAYMANTPPSGQCFPDDLADPFAA